MCGILDAPIRFALDIFFTSIQRLSTPGLASIAWKVMYHSMKSRQRESMLSLSRLLL